MLIKTVPLFSAIWFAGAALAQDPLSAIDWLSDSVAEPAESAQIEETDITSNALPQSVSVTALGGPKIDAVGLLPVSVTGLPRDLWANSTAVDIARRIRAERTDLLPAMQDLLYTLLLAELDPPADSGVAGDLFLAKIDTLLGLGAIEPALAMLERANPTQPELFRRYFDAALLVGQEDKPCALLQEAPELSPTFPARIFCLARTGDWNAAALTLETAQVLGFLSEEEGHLLARFLDPHLFDGQPVPDIGNRITPLTFRLLESIGEGVPTTQLPVAFANANLDENAGWKAQIEASERLVRTGALSANQLLGVYLAGRPAASGGVWNRVKAIQDLNDALSKGDAELVTEMLPAAWAAASEAEIETTFAVLFAEQLLGLPGQPESQAAINVVLLSELFENAGPLARTPSANQAFLFEIAQGDVTSAPAQNGFATAIKDGFNATEIPTRLKSLTDNGRLGEAMLRAIELLTEGSRGDLDEVTDALAFFRAVGLEDTARRAALQLMLLERRG